MTGVQTCALPIWDLLCGRVAAVTVRVQQRAIPPDVLGSDPVADRAYRQRITDWVQAQWSEKDELIDQLVPPSR